MTEHHKRSIVKAITYRFIGSLGTAILVFIFTREPALSLGIGGIELLFKLVFYYLHERFWNHIDWGKKS